MKTIIAVLILAVAGFGQMKSVASHLSKADLDFTVPGYSYFSVGSAVGTTTATLTINSEPTSLVAGPVTINIKTGEITWEKGVAPTEAAKQFAEALKRLWPYIMVCPKLEIPAGEPNHQEVSTKK